MEAACFWRIPQTSSAKPIQYNSITCISKVPASKVPVPLAPHGTSALLRDIHRT